MKITPKMQELVEGVIKDMESSQAMPWKQPWFYAGVRNWKSNKQYHGINSLALGYETRDHEFQCGQFLTFKQAQEAKGTVKKGAHGFPVFFFTKMSVKDKETGENEDVPIMRTYIVFNVDQCEGITPRPDGRRELTANELGDQIIQKCGAEVVYNGAETETPACYIPLTDTVEIPRRDLWKTDEGYYSTVFHELTHWTARRVKRDTSKYHQDKQERAFEELVAELGGAFLAAYVGFKYDTQHSAYLANWVKLLKDHKDALCLAASKAQKAVDFILTQAGLMEAEKEVAA